MIRQRLCGRGEFTTEQLTMRLFLPMLVEATRVLEEEVVCSAREVDMGLTHGLGFLPPNGGLFPWADSLGAAEIVELLEPLQTLGKRYEPTTLLLEMAKHGGTFCDADAPTTKDKAAA